MAQQQQSININNDASPASLQQQTVTKSPSPPLLNGSVDLKSQMLQARRLSQEQNNNHSPPMQASIIGGEGQQQQQRQILLPPMTTQLTTEQAGSILSRMVTAQNSVNGVGIQPFRAVASMQDIRRSRNSLNTVPEIRSGIIPQQRGGMNQTFNLNNRMGSQQQIRTAGGMQQMGGVTNSGQQQMNPLLKMMEERMRAKASNDNQQQTRTVPAPAPMSSQEEGALSASINKWGGMAQQASGSSQAKTVQPNTGESSVQEHQHQLQMPQSSQATGGRVPLSAKQIDLLRELTSSQQNLLRDNEQQQVTQNQLLQQQLLQQQQQLLQQQQQVRGLTRNAVSLAEVDRLRRANQTIQLRQQLVMQERMNEQYNNSVQYIQQRNIAASALAGQAAMSQEDLNKLQADAMNKIKKKLSSGDLNSSSFRKRRSWDVNSHDDDLASLSSRSPSMTSSTSSNKIHRSNSRTAVTGSISMENLRIRSMTNFLVNSPSMRNQSFGNFSSGGSIQQSNNRLSASGFSMKNQSFSSASNLSSQQLRRGLTAGQSASSLASLQQQQQHPSTTLRRNNSSNNWIKSLCDQQTKNSAGKAAATTHEIQALQKMSSSNSINQVQAAITQQIVANTHQEGLVLNKPIQVQAEESLPPSTERSTTTTTNNNTSETIIMSDLPDRIKYQNAKTDVVKPLDVVKDALSSSGAKCDTKPSMDMDDSFFVKVTEMYGGDVMNAIRSNDVDALRKLHANGTKLQCGNKFGETLIHLACRRSSRELVSFLVKEADISLYVRDDFGRTPMHDCCWRASPDLELFDMLLDEAPELLMLCDKRGHTPLDYSRRGDWAELVPFLKERAHKFKPV